MDYYELDYDVLELIIENAGFDVSTYSSPDTQGIPCLSYRVEPEYLLSSAISIAKEAINQLGDVEDESEDVLNELESIFNQARISTTALDNIVYFPRIRYISAFDD